jgi:Fe-S cluster biogenesis protein NfuA
MRATAEELVQAILDMYGEGLARILDLTRQAGAPGQALVETFARDDLVGSLFLLHGLHPIDVETRLALALVEVRPHLKSYAASVELLRFENGVAYLRLERSGRGCGVANPTLKSTLEEAIYKAVPDLEGLQVEDSGEPRAQSKPLTFVPRRRSRESLETSLERGR